MTPGKLGAAAALIALSAFPVLAQESLPAQLAGSWRITRALPTRNTGCWDSAGTLVGSTLTYRPFAMHWRGGVVPLQGVVTRTLTPRDFEKESTAAWGASLTLADLNIPVSRVLEVDLQHEDADITGSTTEVPGDSILIAGRNTIVVSACGTFFEAIRVSTAPAHTAPSSSVAEIRSNPTLKPSSRLNTSDPR